MFTNYYPELIDDLTLRWRSLQAALTDEGVDAMLIASNVNLCYLTGRIFMGYLYLPATGDPNFFVRRPSGLNGSGVHSISKPEEIPALLAAQGLPPPARIMLEGEELGYLEWQRLQALWPAVALPDASQLLRHARAVKSPYECHLMKLTGSRHANVIQRYAACYREGMSDQQWSIAMFNEMLNAGSLGIFRIAGRSMEAFMGTVLAGENGAAVSPYDFALGGAGLHPSLPVGQSGVKLAPGMAVMVDIAANFFGYITDCTRVYSIGKLPQLAYEAHALALEIETAIATAGLPGTCCEELYQLALRMAEQAGLGQYFMGAAQKARFVGHGTGLVINELPVIGARSRQKLQARMCIALEPKFVLPGIGAVGIEDTFMVTDQGMVNLTACPQQIIEL